MRPRVPLCSYGLIVDFPLSSSVILVVAVALWMVWVAPYLLRSRRRQSQAASELMVKSVVVETVDPQAGTVMNLTAQQEKPMDSRKSVESVRGTTSPDAAATAKPEVRTSAGRDTFRIRYGRCAIAMVGVVSLLTALLSVVLLAFGIGASWLPVFSSLVGVAALVLLRRLAVRDRRAKVNVAFRAAMSAPTHRSEPIYRSSSRLHANVTPASKESAERAEIPPFDAEAGQPATNPLTARELRAAALAVAVASGDNSVRAPKLPVAGPDNKWEPVKVPKPTYVGAAKAERPAPEPLDLPVAPKPVGKPSLKQETSSVPAAETDQSRPLAKSQSALSDLNDVLQRRRA